MNPFDADTALEQVGDARWRGDVPRSWWIGAGPNGGFFAALAARAAQLATGWPPRSLTVHYLSAPTEGPVEVAAKITRQGRSTAFLRLAITQDGRDVSQAIAVCGPWLEKGVNFQDAEPPELPAPDTLERARASDKVAPLVERYDLRPDPSTDGGLPAVARGWIRAAEPRRSDTVLLAAMADAFLPPIFLRERDVRVFVPTLELTTHFRGLPPEGEHPWIAATFTSRFAAGGLVEEDGELWSSEGRLLVQSRQLSLIRER